jgi:hypothetical protein
MTKECNCKNAQQEHEPVPTVTLTFPMNAGDEDLMCALNGSKFSSILWDLDNELRSVIKHNAKFPRQDSDLSADAAEQLREWLREACHERGIVFPGG